VLCATRRNTKHGNLIFSLKSCKLRCFANKRTQTHWNYRLVTADPRFICKTIDYSTACYRLLPDTHRLPSLLWCKIRCCVKKLESFFVKPRVKSWWYILQRRCGWHFVFQQNSAPTHGSTQATQFNCCSAKLSTSLLPGNGPQQPRAEFGYKISEFHRSVRVASQQNWRNHAATGWTLATQ